MTDDDFTLNPTDTARWDAIVNEEWASQLAPPTIQARVTYAGARTSLDAGTPPTLTIYLPRRPTVLRLAVSALLTGIAVWVAISFLAPAYQLAVLSGLSRGERADAIRQLTVTAAVIAVILVLAATSISVWLVAFARYRLRRASCDQVALGIPTTTQHVRPPNPATAINWVLLQLTAATTAWWWIVPRLDGATSSGPDAIDALNVVAVGAIAWLAVVLLGAVGLTAWASREARHRLRRCAAKRQ